MIMPRVNRAEISAATEVQAIHLVNRFVQPTCLQMHVMPERKTESEPDGCHREHWNRRATVCR